MSTTPRTDAAKEKYLTGKMGFYDVLNEARELETELAAAKLDAEDQAKWALCYLARAEKAEAELAKRDSEYLRGTKMVAESASVWQTRAEKAEADTARLDWLQSSVSLHVNSIALRGDIRDAIDAAMKEGSK